MSGEDTGRSSYLDLLIATLTEHEKNLDRLLEKLEKVSEGLSTYLGKAELKSERSVVKREISGGKDDSGTLIYMKIKLGRSLDDVIKILESLKE